MGPGGAKANTPLQSIGRRRRDRSPETLAI